MSIRMCTKCVTFSTISTASEIDENAIGNEIKWMHSFHHHLYAVCEWRLDATHIFHHKTEMLNLCDRNCILLGDPGTPAQWLFNSLTIYSMRSQVCVTLCTIHFGWHFATIETCAQCTTKERREWCMQNSIRRNITILRRLNYLRCSRKWIDTSIIIMMFQIGDFDWIWIMAGSILKNEGYILWYGWHQQWCSFSCWKLNLQSCSARWCVRAWHVWGQRCIGSQFWNGLQSIIQTKQHQMNSHKWEVMTKNDDDDDDGDSNNTVEKNASRETCLIFKQNLSCAKASTSLAERSSYSLALSLSFNGQRHSMFINPQVIACDLLYDTNEIWLLQWIIIKS